MSRVAKVMGISMFTNVGLSIFKIVFGIIGKSSALIADGIHSFSDLTTDVIAIFGDRLAQKPADLKHPYGHGKTEYITSIFIGMVIFILGFTIVYETIQKEVQIPSMIVIVVSLVTILAKLLLSRYIMKKGREYQNNILIASGKESSTDVISSIVVLISGILMQFTDTWSGFQYADKIASVIVGMFILHVGYQVLKENISIILGEQETDPDFLALICEEILKDTNIKSVDSLVILKFGPYFKLVGEVGIEGDISLKQAHDYIEDLEERLKEKEPKFRYITIHMNPYLQGEQKKIDSEEAAC